MIDSNKVCKGIHLELFHSHIPETLLGQNCMEGTQHCCEVLTAVMRLLLTHNAKLHDDHAQLRHYSILYRTRGIESPGQNDQNDQNELERLVAASRILCDVAK